MINYVMIIISRLNLCFWLLASSLHRMATEGLARVGCHSVERERVAWRHPPGRRMLKRQPVSVRPRNPYFFMYEIPHGKAAGGRPYFYWFFSTSAFFSLWETTCRRRSNRVVRSVSFLLRKSFEVCGEALADEDLTCYRL